MGFMDGAVNGMASRLAAVGFTPDEAFCLAQSAYIKNQRRATGVPQAVLDRKDASWEINQTVNALGPYPMGNEAHRQRIILWEKIFGFGSWHEPIDPAEIYSPMELLAHGYRTPGVIEDVDATAPPTAHVAQKRFQKLVVGQPGLSFAEQLDYASRRVEKKLKSAVEEAGYIWNKDDGEYFLFSTGENLSGYELSEEALIVLSTHPRGTGCALAVITARKA